jgi:hypothetical protein
VMPLLRSVNFLRRKGRSPMRLDITDRYLLGYQDAVNGESHSLKRMDASAIAEYQRGFDEGIEDLLRGTPVLSGRSIHPAVGPRKYKGPSSGLQGRAGQKEAHARDTLPLPDLEVLQQRCLRGEVIRPVAGPSGPVAGQTDGASRPPRSQSPVPQSRCPGSKIPSEPGLLPSDLRLAAVSPAVVQMASDCAASWRHKRPGLI